MKSESYVRLPKIVVIGNQSSGKSSVLESLLGLDFIPKGDYLVTKRPLEIRTYNSKESSKPYAIFEERKDRKIYNFEKVKQIIDDLTFEFEHYTNSTKDIFEIPIILNIYGKHLPELTLIDIPGITRSCYPYSYNIEEVSKRISHKYCKYPDTIILCILNANSDIAVSDALKMAREIDPKGKRTIGVLTKLDIMDRGTDASYILKNLDFL